MSQAAQIFRFIVNHNTKSQIIPKLVLALIYQFYKRAIKKPLVKKLFNGKKIWLFPDNPISSAFVYCDVPDQEEIDAFRQLACENTIFIDVGANIGAYSILLSDKVKTVYAFEAHPETAEYCKMNFKLNGISEDHVIQMAVCENSEPKLFTNSKGGSPINAIGKEQNGSIIVPAISLDAFIKAKQFPAEMKFLLKIDVEGFEYQVMEGGRHFLENGQVIALIFETFSDNQEKILAMLTSFGFTLKSIGQHNLLAVRHHAI